MTRWGCLDCHTQFGAWLSRCPRCGSAKELVVALNACTACTTKFAVGSPKCPHCGSTEYVEDGAMAKITAHGGPSDKTLPAPEAEAVDAPAPEPDAEDVPAAEQPDVTETAPEPEPEEEEGGEESSPGNNSSASTEKPQPNSEPSSKPRRKPARKTASPSEPGLTESSSARSTDGDPTDGTSAADADNE